MRHTLIFHIGHSAGFYSEFNNMVLAILYCRRHGYNFELYSKDANFGQGKGWEDFFIPFCKETSWIGHHYINHRYESPQGALHKILLEVYKAMHPHTYLTFDLWNEFRHLCVTEMTPIEVREAAGKIMSEIYRFNDSTWSEINALMQQVTLNEPYIGFHIRGGDKIIEHDIHNVEQYISIAEKQSNIRTAFVSTDDYIFVSLFKKKYPEWKIYTLTTEDEHGYFHQDFENQSSLIRRKKLLIMFASMEYLRRAEYAICTYSSNIGMFLGALMGDRAIGVDYKDWLVW